MNRHRHLIQRRKTTLLPHSGKRPEVRLIIVIAHRLSTITSADQIIFLEDGHVYEQGSHEVLMGLEDGHYRRFVELQTA